MSSIPPPLHVSLLAARQVRVSIDRPHPSAPSSCSLMHTLLGVLRRATPAVPSVLAHRCTRCWTDCMPTKCSAPTLTSFPLQSGRICTDTQRVNLSTTSAGQYARPRRLRNSRGRCAPPPPQAEQNEASGGIHSGREENVSISVRPTCLISYKVF